SGRQAAALAADREGRKVMVGELGIEPGRELQELERAILRQDPALDGDGSRAAERGPVVCAGCAPLALVEALGRELLLVELAADAAALAEASERLERVRPPHPRPRPGGFPPDGPQGAPPPLAP